MASQELDHMQPGEDSVRIDEGAAPTRCNPGRLGDESELDQAAQTLLAQTTLLSDDVTEYHTEALSPDMLPCLTVDAVEEFHLNLPMPRWQSSP